jgi:tetratricopeptide (TPR) repeat protein
LATGLAFALNARVPPSSLELVHPKNRRALPAAPVPPPPASGDLPEASAAGEIALDLLAQDRLSEGWAAAERGWALLERGAPPSVLRLATARGLLALARGAPEIALECAARGEAHDGPAADFHLLRGWALETQALDAPGASPERAARLAQAAQAYAAALELHGLAVVEKCVLGAAPWIIWTRLGAVQLAQGRAALAAESFERALAFRADHLEALLGRAEARLGLGDAKGALALVEPLLTAAPDAWAIAAFAAGALGAGDDAALFLARALSTRKPWVSAAWCARAQALRTGAAREA